MATDDKPRGIQDAEASQSIRDAFKAYEKRVADSGGEAPNTFNQEVQEALLGKDDQGEVCATCGQPTTN